VVDPSRPKKIVGDRLLAALTEAGIIHGGDSVRRVVIDATLPDYP